VLFEALHISIVLLEQLMATLTIPLYFHAYEFGTLLNNTFRLHPGPGLRLYYTLVDRPVDFGMAHCEERENLARHEPDSYAGTHAVLEEVNVYYNSEIGRSGRVTRSEDNIMISEYEEKVIHAQSVITICDIVSVEWIKHRSCDPRHYKSASRCGWYGELANSSIA
jgi:hypothetical protein